MKTKRIILIIIPIIIAFFIGILSIFHVINSENKPGESESIVSELSGEPIVSSEPVSEPESSSEPEEVIPVFEEYDITLMSVGDDLLHMGIINSGLQADGTYNYDVLFQNITEFIDKADISTINQETILGGNHLGFSGYPAFNSPTEVGDAIAKAGFNVVLHATNHTADRGLEGIQNATNFWAENYPEVLMVGMSAEPQENPEIPVITVKEKTFAILNYTYGPNMATLPSYLWGRLNMLCDYDSNNGAIDFTTLNPTVLSDIERAKEVADIVIVFPHWGNEYQTTPSDYQKKFAMQMTEAGADLIVGTHPHVPQPVEMIQSENGNTSLCYYSLGNYVSSQINSHLRMLGEMAWVTFHVTENDMYIDLEKTGVIPLVCHYNNPPTKFENIYLLEDYTEEKAITHGMKSRSEVAVDVHLSTYQNSSQEIFGDWILTRDQVLNDNYQLQSEPDEEISTETNQ